MDDLSTCPRCKARSPEEAETMCRPTSDETGEYSCHGTEWPLENIWSGEITTAEAGERLAAEEAYWAAMPAPSPAPFDASPVVCDDCPRDVSRGPL